MVFFPYILIQFEGFLHVDSKAFQSGLCFQCKPRWYPYRVCCIPSGDGEALLNVTDIYGLKQLINESTRITPLTRTLIDLIFNNQPDNVYCSGVPHVTISDNS